MDWGGRGLDCFKNGVIFFTVGKKAEICLVYPPRGIHSIKLTTSLNRMQTTVLLLLAVVVFVVCADGLFNMAKKFVFFLGTIWLTLYFRYFGRTLNKI